MAKNYFYIWVTLVSDCNKSFYHQVFIIYVKNSRISVFPVLEVILKIKFYRIEKIIENTA